MTIDRAKHVLLIEADAIRALAERLGQEFVSAISILKNCKGKVVVTGLGKSGLVGQKISATFASTGTPSFFLHPAEGLHGDIGMLSKGDVVLALSNSGETEELLKLVPYFRRLELPIIALTGKTDSTLAKSAEVVLDVSVKEEACPYNLVPTASTTAMLAMGDALALALLEEKGFKPEDFALLHPAGTLGRKLLLKVSDLMQTGDRLPAVGPDAGLKEVILTMSSKMLGHAAVVEKGNLLGVVSDGDLRRAMEKYPDLFSKKARDIMTKNPKSVHPDDLAVAALAKMEKHNITALLVTDDPSGKHLVGIIHLHDLLKAGVV
jgi:arabinose-5-phosphate isomerase